MGSTRREAFICDDYFKILDRIDRYSEAVGCHMFVMVRDIIESTVAAALKN